MAHIDFIIKEDRLGVVYDIVHAHLQRIQQLALCSLLVQLSLK